MTYKISLTNTGLETVKQARAMAEAMIQDGHDVEFAGYDCIQDCDDDGVSIVCPVSDQDWNSYLESAQ